MARKPAARYRAKVDSVGRVLIPAPLRQKFGVQPGATVSITEGRAGRIVLESRTAALREAQEYFCSLAPSTALWSEELITERRREARACSTPRPSSRWQGANGGGKRFKPLSIVP
jgi:AbrB family looped-hinge helix DNA binding protein